MSRVRSYTSLIAGGVFGQSHRLISAWLRTVKLFMASLSPASASAIARLRSYVPPPTTWYSLPLSRRAAVLILLFADKSGDLRVVLTMRSGTLRSYAGQAALPGGKSDTLTETPLQTARREAFEEIGLPLPLVASTSPPNASSTSNIIDTPDTPGLPYPFRLEHLCQLPTHLAKTELGVRPVVAYLYATSLVDRNNKPVDAATALIPRLDAKEVAAVFTGPLHNFLKAKDELPVTKDDGGIDGKWYKGSWIDWHETQFRMHNFYIPVKGQVVTRPRKHKEKKPQPKTTLTKAEISAYPLQLNASNPAATPLELPPLYPPSTDSSPLPYRDHPDTDAPDPLDALTRFRVFGMTARILVDCARLAYEEEPEFEHNMNFGDEDIIARLIEVGKLDGERRKGDEFEGDEMVRSLAASRLGGRL